MDTNERPPQDEAARLEAVEKRATTVLARLGLTWEDLEGKSLLDVGAGQAAVGEAAMRRGILAVSIDRHPEEWKERGAAIPATTPYAQADAGRLPFADASFDVVISHAAPPTARAESPEEAWAAIAEAVRVLKPGGEYRFGPGPLSAAALAEKSALPEASHDPRLKWRRQEAMMDASLSQIRALLPETTVEFGLTDEAEPPYDCYFLYRKPLPEKHE